MYNCQLRYIPINLHYESKSIIFEFEIGEFLYRRCKPEELENPFQSISITELSHNRSGDAKNPLCAENDVLYNISNDENERYINRVVCTLEIKSLNENKGYKKTYSQQKNDKKYFCSMELIHEPDPFMYPHCVFRISINDETITYENYDSTIKKLNQIRNQLKDELASMILRKQISMNDNPSN